MDDKMLLDVLFIAIGVLLLPIGYWRGVTREVFVTAGLLFGMSLSLSWARPWGEDLADLLDRRVGTGQFVVSVAFMVGAAVIFGYGGPAAVGLERPGRWSRGAGTVLAFINGALLSAFVLRDIERFLSDEGTLRRINESDIAHFLLRELGWVLIGAGVAMLALIVVGLIAGDRGDAPAAAPAPRPEPVWSVPVQAPKRKSRLGWGRDDGKVEPRERGFDPVTGRYQADAANYMETMPIAPVGSAAWSVDRAQRQPTGGNEWLEVARPQTAGDGATSHSATSAGADRCLSCGERLTPEDLFCPRCGRARNG